MFTLLIADLDKEPTRKDAEILNCLDLRHCFEDQKNDMKVSGECSLERGEDKEKGGHAMVCTGSEIYKWSGQMLWACHPTLSEDCLGKSARCVGYGCDDYVYLVRFQS
jgi:hypothetical protein